MTDEDRRRFLEVQQYDPGELLEQNFYWAQSRIVGILEGDVNLDKQAKLVIALCGELVEQGELSEGFVKLLRLKLANFDLPDLVSIMNQSASLANSARNMARHGEMTAQVNILKSFLIDVMRMSGEVTVRKRSLQALTELKIEAGLPIEDMDAVLKAVRRSDQDDGRDEDEDERDSDPDSQDDG